MKVLAASLFLLGAIAFFAIRAPRLQAFADDRAEISAIENRLLDGVKTKDVDKIMSCYSPDESLFVFDVIPPRQYVGAKAYRKDWDDLFAMFPTIQEASISDISVTADHNLGYARLITHGVFVDKTGKKMESYIRTTDVFRKSGGKWLIVHEHNSVPVDLATGQADMMSKP